LEGLGKMKCPVCEDDMSLAFQGKYAWCEWCPVVLKFGQWFIGPEHELSLDDWKETPLLMSLNVSENCALSNEEFLGD